MSAEHARSFHSAFESFCAVIDHEVRRCALDEATASQQQRMQLQQQSGAADAKEHATRLFTAYTQLEMQTDRIAIYLVRGQPAAAATAVSAMDMAGVPDVHNSQQLCVCSV